MSKPTTLGELRQTEWASPARIRRAVKDEMRANLVCLLENGSPLFPGIVGYEDTVIPQLINAILSRHNFILLGLRGQAKSRILRQLVTLGPLVAPSLVARGMQASRLVTGSDEQRNCRWLVTNPAEPEQVYLPSARSA